MVEPRGLRGAIASWPHQKFLFYTLFSIFFMHFLYAFEKKKKIFHILLMFFKVQK